MDKVKKVKGRGLMLMVLSAWLIAGSGLLMGGSGKAETVSVLQGPELRAEVSRGPFSMRVLDPAGKELLRTTGKISFTTVTKQKPYQFIAWWKWTPAIKKPWTHADQVVSLEKKNDELVVELAEETGGKALVRLRAFFIDSGALRVETRVLDRPDVNRLVLRFRKHSDDRYYGMGERFNSAEHSGERVRVWCEEGGLGIGRLHKVLPGLSFNPFPKGKDMTYYPVPFFLNTRGYGFLLDDTHYSAFDFGKKDPEVVEIENWNRSFDFMIFYGPSPLEVIESQTDYTGRITPPLPWVFGVWNVCNQGEDRLYQVAQTVREENIPTSAIWAEDWWWREEWTIERDRYPHYEKMIADLHRDGFRYLGYFQPNISPGTSAFVEGDSRGYFTKNEEGETYLYDLAVWEKAQLDLTNPEAREWWKQSFFKKAESWGVDGWMHDFSEYTPPDSVSYDGTVGWELHNYYPVLWAKLGREFWEKARPDGDWVFFMRGGYTGTQKYAPVMWTGDQNSSFGKLDGLPSNIPALLSVGISGHPVGTTDIAGYHCGLSTPTDKELFMRWAELGALCPVMRNHRGHEPCDHWRFDQDRETLLHYKKYARLHASLFPYIYTLVHQAAEHGYPVMRHLVLHYPGDPGSARQDYEFLLGDRLLVAPVLKDGARVWEVYLPPGKWYHYWSGKAYEGPGKQTVPAPLGETPLFVKKGAILPLYDKRIDTLVREDKQDLQGFTDANRSLEVAFYGNGADELKLWDNTRISCTRKPGKKGSCKVTDAPVKRTYSFDFRE
ncbi:MAG: glycoside hydrolase family 31 protein [bacterium]